MKYAFFTFLFLLSFKLSAQHLKEFTDKLMGKTLRDTQRDFNVFFKRKPQLIKVEVKEGETIETYMVIKNEVNIHYFKKYDIGCLVILPNSKLTIKNEVSIQSIKTIEDAIALLGKPQSFEVYSNPIYDNGTYKIYLSYDNPQSHTAFIFTPNITYTENKECIKIGDEFYNTIKKNKLEQIQIFAFLSDPPPYVGCLEKTNSNTITDINISKYDSLNYVLHPTLGKIYKDINASIEGAYSYREIRFIINKLRDKTLINLKGRVFVKFIVDNTGKIHEPDILKEAGENENKEALRIIQQLSFIPPSMN